ncbi:hypothetical protein ACHAQH_004030 [Verticillium albo-atrum]
MKLDTKALRYLASEDWNVLAAVERGSRDHELVPTSLIEKYARVKGGVNGVHRSISALAKVGLIARVKEAKYDGYRFTYGGFDYLALHDLSKRKEIYSVGSRVGVGKESDITMVADHKGVQKILKIHRLGRISFRSVKTNRDYLKNRQSGSWQYLSRLAAMKEYAFMKVLQEEGFPIPQPIAQSRHTVLMEFVDSTLMRQISDVPDPATLYGDLIDLILRLAKHGLIHGDFNEFNLLIKEVTSTEFTESGEEKETITLVPIVIDFPQMVSMDHANAEMYFDRDVNCIKRFFERKFDFVSTTPGPFFKDAKKTMGRDGVRRLDAAAEASGFTKKMAKDLEKAIREQETLKEHNGGQQDDDDDDDDEYEDGEEEEEEEGSAGEVTESPAINSTTQGGSADSPADLASEQERKPESEEVDTQRLSKLAIADGT